MPNTLTLTKAALRTGKLVVKRVILTSAAGSFRTVIMLSCADSYYSRKAKTTQIKQV